MAQKGLLTKEGKRKPETEMSELEKLRAENKILQAEKRRAQLEAAFLKTRRNRKEAVLSQTQNETVYLAIQEIYDEQGCPVSELCRFAGISRSAYYKWLNRKPSENEKFNQKLCVLIRDAYEEKSGILGYRQMTIKLNRENEFQVNAKENPAPYADFTSEVCVPAQEKKLCKINARGYCRKHLKPGVPCGAFW